MLLSVPPRAEAQSDGTHYQTLIVGDRSMGLGTAFTGLANDGSAVYYNPAGLSFREGTAITGGFWLNAFDTKRIYRGLQRSYGAFDLVSHRVPSFPAFASSNIGLGKKAKDGHRRFVLGLSALRLRSDEFVARVRALNPEVGLEETYDIAQYDRITYYGLTFGWRAKRFLGAGVSLFLSRRSFGHQEIAYTVTGPQPFDIDQSQGTSGLSDIGLKAYQLVLRFGILKTLSARTQLGVMLQVPGIPLWVRGRRRYQRLAYDLTAMPSSADYVSESQSSLKAHSPTPAELRVGTAWKATPILTWTHDLGVVSPVLGRDVIPIAGAADAPRRGLFFDPSTARRPVVNLATGLEIRTSAAVQIRMGAFTNFSGARRIPAVADVYRNPRLQVVGFSTSVALRGAGRGLALGITGTLGRGKALASVADSNNLPNGYVQTRMKAHAIFVALTGAVEAAEKLVRQTAGKMAPGMIEQTEPKGK